MLYLDLSVAESATDQRRDAKQGTPRLHVFLPSNQSSSGVSAHPGAFYYGEMPCFARLGWKQQVGSKRDIATKLCPSSLTTTLTTTLAIRGKQRRTRLLEKSGVKASSVRCGTLCAQRGILCLQRLDLGLDLPLEMPSPFGELCLAEDFEAIPPVNQLARDSAQVSCHSSAFMPSAKRRDPPFGWDALCQIRRFLRLRPIQQVNRGLERSSLAAAWRITRHPEHCLWRNGQHQRVGDD